MGFEEILSAFFSTFTLFVYSGYREECHFCLSHYIALGGVIDVWKYVPLQPDVSYFQPSEITIFSLNPFSPKAATTTTEGLQQTCE